jgi:hypothetical protein
MDASDQRRTENRGRNVLELAREVFGERLEGAAFETTLVLRLSAVDATAEETARLDEVAKEAT